MSRPDAHATREQVLHLLAEAAEFEHNLLCCYLYAAFSLKRPDTKGVSRVQSEAIERWRQSVMSVAIEEMAHLALIANISVALGSRAHFNRPNLPVSPGYHPAGMVVELAAFEPETLEHFIFLERPAGLQLPDGRGFEAEKHVPREGPRGLMPGAFDYATIAEFYAGLCDTLTAATDHLGPGRLFCGTGMQIGPDIAALPGLRTIDDLPSALAAIDTIVEQGEGASTDADDSHFQRFSEIQEEYQRLLQADPAFAPAWPCARNPVMRRPVEPEGRIQVDHPDALPFVDLANALYNHMLRLLVQAFGRGGSDPAPAARLMQAAITVMSVFGRVSEHVATLPASRSTAGVHAGVSFAILRSTEPLASGASEFSVLAERFDELSGQLRSLGAALPGLAKGAEKLEQVAASFRAYRR